MIKTYEIPRLTPKISEQEYTNKLREVLDIYNLDYSNFTPSQEDKKLYDINSKIDTLYRNENLANLTNSFVKQILKITDTIFLPNGDIQEDFEFVRLSATENDGHGHVVIAKMEVDSNGEVSVHFTIVENEMKTLNTVDENPEVLLLAKNAFFKLTFDYKRAKLKKERKFLGIFNQSKSKIPDKGKYELNNFHATKIVSDKLELYIADLACYNPIESLVYGKFYDKIKPAGNTADAIMIVQREYILLMKELRTRSIFSNHKDHIQSSSQHSDQP